MSLTMGQALAVKRLKAQNWGVDAIAAKIHAPADLVRKVYHRHAQGKPRDRRPKKLIKPKTSSPRIPAPAQIPRCHHGKYYIKSGRTEADLDEPERMHVPDDVLIERRRMLDYEPPTLTAAVFGDPPPWRSALAKRAQSE